MTHFDVMVIGAGHAGCEAALAAARLGMHTAILTITLDNIGQMSCNPSIGGPAKSHLVKELDALGGEMGRNIDKSFIQMRVLNTRKGPAVQSLRAQADKTLYHKYMKETLENCSNLQVIQGMVSDILVSDIDGKKQITGLKTREGVKYSCDAIVVCSGTFMNGLIHVGDAHFSGGRMGEMASVDLPASLASLGLTLGRFKTGTPPRIDGDTIDYSTLEVQPGVVSPMCKFSNRTTDEEILTRNQINCYVTHTNAEAHTVIKSNKERSPLFNGTIQGTGPRYCPSIEDKVFRYADKDSHHIFLEQEGVDTKEVYLSGLSSSLPADVQEQVLSRMDGMSDAQIMRFAYAIEYDYVVPSEIQLTLETRKISGLYLAGQINGTSGYEEAAVQGLMAGINAARKLSHKAPVILDRTESYIGTLIDDLVTKGTNEPYRMFTARSEYRLMLREDNADIRLTHIGHDIGLVGDEEYDRVEHKKKLTADIIAILQNTFVGPKNLRINEVLSKCDEKLLTNGTTLFELLKRPAVKYADIEYIAEYTSDEEEMEKLTLPAVTLDIAYQIEVQVKYAGYIDRSMKMIEHQQMLENRKIPEDIDYNTLANIPKEAQDKLSAVRPINIGQASRISGVSPADIQILLMHLKMRNDTKQ